MRVNTEIRVATNEDLIALAADMRQADKDEVYASGGYSPLEALFDSAANSDFTHAILFNGQVGFVVGVDGTHGVVWALTGNLVNKYPKEFARVTRAIVHGLSRKYPVLQNMVDARYSAALRWVRWLGFKVYPAVPFGVEGLPFHPIILESDHV